MYKKITVIVDSDLSKLALVKQSLVGVDRQATNHMDKTVDILDLINPILHEGGGPKCPKLFLYKKNIHMRFLES